jgi:hypothetical protein
LRNKEAAIVRDQSRDDGPHRHDIFGVDYRRRRDGCNQAA